MRHLRDLLRDRDTREAERRFVVEGRKTLGEARRSGAAVESVYIDPRTASPADRQEADACAAAGAEVFEVEPGVLDRAADTVTPQAVAAVVGMVDVALAAATRGGSQLMVVCAEVRDPGNLGSILRSAGAAGASAVVCCQGSVDMYNPKAVRASAGALFRVPVTAGTDPKEVLDEVARSGVTRWGTAADGGVVYSDADLTTPMALVVGNEAHGLPAWMDAHLDGTLRIPMASGFESLNVATATAVICFEAARQRAG
jgi:TrmH family RNA methyltransferase